MHASAKPILFSGPMVRALLDGRKSQTRRVLKPADGERLLCRSCGVTEREFKADKCSCRTPDLQWTPCEAPRHRVGDLLWVREGLRAASNDQGRRWLSYAADDADVWPLTEWTNDRNTAPSIHMPRWASRLTLKVTEVRVQRVQEISEADAIAEGVKSDLMHYDGRPASRIDGFAGLWDSLNAKRAPWDSNPWVCAVAFDVIKANVDQVLRAAA